MPIRTTGSRMWSNRLGALAITGQGAKYRPAAIYTASRIRKKTAYTLMPPTPAVASTGT
ncbi:hypothetical protein GCM10010103_65040 [Streptomyces paradoxus]|uniref:Uncharacterized protein n=1 Tax=Streptomyces paradoxus TaxID=66375 RepID=A0A7W9THY7_9ACTN|nr:hypothetical protein [Streptomyces paradoxus]MBB6081085.1 hypothetical protein [Streptomyces paradoxus]